MKNQITNGFLIDTNQPQNVYLLGLIWADGWICKNGSMGLSLTKDDFLNIEKILNYYGINCIYERQRYKNDKIFGRESKTAQMRDKNIFSFLTENDYKIKSFIAPNKILSLIPENLQHYWWRGYFDGDGCLYIKHRNLLSFWSSINQDWKKLTDLLNKLNITNYSIIKYKRKNNKHLSSALEIRKIKQIEIFLDFIYQNRENDKIGLNRKYETYLLLKGKSSRIKINTSQYKHICFNKRNKKWKSSAYIGKNYIHLGWFNTESEAYKKQQDYLYENKLKMNEYPDITDKEYIS